MKSARFKPSRQAAFSVGVEKRTAVPMVASERRGEASDGGGGESRPTARVRLRRKNRGRRGRLRVWGARRGRLGRLQVLTHARDIGRAHV